MCEVLDEEERQDVKMSWCAESFTVWLPGGVDEEERQDVKWWRISTFGIFHSKTHLNCSMWKSD